LDTNRQPIAPCSEKRARLLLERGQAAVLRCYPFTIILKYPIENPTGVGQRIEATVEDQSNRLKGDLSMAHSTDNTRSKSLYSLHPSYAMEASYLANLQQRTGKTLEEWIRLVKKTGPPTEQERRQWLQTEHHLTTNYAWWIAERAEGKGGAENYDPEALVDAMFAGAKAGLRPIYEQLLKLGLKLGRDVRACPCQTIVPLYRRHVFAELKPATRKRDGSLLSTRIDLGLALKDLPASGRLISTGGLAKKDRITHRIPVTTLAEIDDQVRYWLKAAYDLDA
jgi:hypothetical protein